MNTSPLSAKTTITEYLASGKPFAIISAEKHNYSKTANDLSDWNLRKSLAENNLSFTPVIGYYKESTDSKPVKEKSYFVPSDIDHRVLMQHLCEVFGQECVLFSNGKEIGFLTPTQFTPQFTQVNFNPVNLVAWTEVDDLRFSFE